ncbi:acyl-CoA thioesterase [Paenibacillus sp. CAA11]|uniref:SGNH/GDSL hydrolase family protein n=1 Tax=Paenibacillus sp. CAA11 TaxID=1532905 RepID=UPI000D3A6B3A|nr:SGNH/GDSL hydrolase family protein [Paenibacillus sp. CAA11]AWB44674.1 acyl-CoA thioesterase [Paenibacillus sp. CAA11]
MNENFLRDLRSNVGDGDGPIAPKDPVAKRSGFYVIHESLIESTVRPDGKLSHEIYLEGRLAEKARYTGGVLDESILTQLGNSSGFRQLVHSIGISVKAEDSEISSVQFTMENREVISPYESGSQFTISCPADGSEVILILDQYERSPNDEVPGKFTFEFEQGGVVATASVKFYLHDGYQVPEATTEPPIDFESQAYHEMIAKSLLNKGNNRRLKAAIKKAKKGEEVTIAYIGGSITQGATAVPLHKECYAYRSYNLFKQMFGQDGTEKVHLIKAGVGGTPSELGLVRYERDVLRDGAVNPEIVIVEFAVNDAGDETRGNCYESLVLKALNSPNKPAVILLFSVFIDDWNLQERLAPVGWHYNLPMVSIKDAVVDQFRLSRAEGKVISKKQFFYDIYHPTNAGHKIMSDCLGWLFEVTDRSSLDEQDITTDKPPMIGNDFVNVRLLDRRNADAIADLDIGSFREIDTDLQMVELDDHPYASPQFPYNWMHAGNDESQGFKMTIFCKRLLLVYKDSGKSEFGTAEIWVDGKLFKTADPHENNWTHCNAVILVNEQVAAEHTIEIKMAAEHKEKQFTILAFGYGL